jgi:arsenate reductase
VEYLKTGWTADQLKALFGRMGIGARQALRTRGTRAEELGLTAPGASDTAIIAAMVAEPSLVERPIVETPKGAALCRPAETCLKLL